MSEAIQQLRRAALLRDVAGLADGRLLEDHLLGRDEAALEALVLRHARNESQAVRSTGPGTEQGAT
jgi:hypothetical protein